MTDLQWYEMLDNDGKVAADIIIGLLMRTKGMSLLQAVERARWIMREEVAGA